MKELYCVTPFHSQAAPRTPVIRMELPSLRRHCRGAAGEKQWTYRLLGQAALSCLADVSKSTL